MMETVILHGAVVTLCHASHPAGFSA